MHLVLSDKLALDIKVSLPRPSFFVHVGQVSAYVCLEDAAPAAAGLPFYERRKWRTDIATERQWWIGRLAISLAMPRCTGSALAKRLAKLGVGYGTGVNETSALTQTETAGSRASLARMAWAGLVQTKGLGSSLRSFR
jgi:hypothetical protein